LVDICGYELPTNLQNFTQKENIRKSFRGAAFFKHPVQHAAGGMSAAWVSC